MKGDKEKGTLRMWGFKASGCGKEDRGAEGRKRRQEVRGVQGTERGADR